MHSRRLAPFSLTDPWHRQPHRRPHCRHLNDARAPADWQPAVDILERGDRFVLRVDVPGVDPADIRISAKDSVLSIAGERPAPKQADDGALRRLERGSGSFERRFTLPETADAEGIRAKSINGLLEVSIPKLPRAQARRIAVDAA